MAQRLNSVTFAGRVLASHAQRHCRTGLPAQTSRHPPRYFCRNACQWVCVQAAVMKTEEHNEQELDRSKALQNHKSRRTQYVHTCMRVLTLAHMRVHAHMWYALARSLTHGHAHTCAHSCKHVRLSLRCLLRPLWWSLWWSF